MNISLIKKSIFSIGLLALSTGLMSCSGDEPNPTPTPTPEPEEETTNRTILVYMVASNSLGSWNYDTADIKEMTLAAQNGALKGNRLILFHQDTSGEQILKEVSPETGEIVELETLSPDLSSVSSARMEEVIGKVKKYAPADDYGMILWSHANGWIVQSATPDEYSVAPLAFGQETLNGKSLYMNTQTLASTLMGKDLSFIYFDCCYMACVEVLYDLIGVTDRVVASTAEVIAEGMPYHLTLPYLFAKGKADLEGAAKAVYDYVNAKTDVNQTGTFAVFDMTKVDALAKATKDFYSLKPVTSSSFSPQRYMYETTCYHFDFGHIIENMNQNAEGDNSSEFVAARKKVLDAIDDVVTYKAATPYIWPGDRQSEIKVEHFSGMSSNYLTSASRASVKGYDQTAWWNDVARYLFE